METNQEEILNQSLDYIIHQLIKGNIIEGLKAGQRHIELHQVKEWKSKYGYQFHVYSNDHPLDKKPHFHILKESDNIDCRFFFDSSIYDCKGQNKLEKKVIEALGYFLEQNSNITKLINLWNNKNPNYKVDF
jgi:hypothetical protein